MTSSPRLLIAIALLHALLMSAGCAPLVGDTCATDVECDTQNGESCDLSVPNGYCTLLGCNPGDCGEESVCILFEDETSACMLYCDDASGCREEHVCRTDIPFEATRAGEPLEGGFCYVTPPE